MSDRTFVVEISDRAMPHSVEHIGQGLLALNGNGLHSALARSTPYCTTSCKVFTTRSC